MQLVRYYLALPSGRTGISAEALWFDIMDIYFLILFIRGICIVNAGQELVGKSSTSLMTVKTSSLARH